MKLTTGYEFQGYFITEYLDVIFDEMLVGLGLGKSLAAGLDNFFSVLGGTEATEMVDKLNDVKMQLRERVIEKAKKLGANALIGIDFESSKVGDLIMVSMTATAVKIDRIISPLPYTETQQEQKHKADRKVIEKAERSQRQEPVPEQPHGFDKESFWIALNELQSAKEMVEFIQAEAAKYPDIFSDSLISSISKYPQLERMYGRGAGRKDVLFIVMEHLGLG